MDPPLDKIGQQKSVVCRAKIGRFYPPIKSSDVIVQHRTGSILDDIIGELFGDCLQWKMDIRFLFIYFGSQKLK